VGYGSANFFEGAAAATLSNTTSASRASNGCVDTDNNASDFTVGAPAPRNTASLLNPCSTTAEPKINEFSASTAGNDVEYVEVFGTPNTDYSAYKILEIEGEGTGIGVVDEVISVGSTDANGFWLQNLANGALENGTLSLLLVKNFTGALNSDLDTNNDGTFDVTPWDAVTDAVSVNDGSAGDTTFGVPSLGPNYDGLSSFAPGGASRIPDGFDTESATDWARNDFDLFGIPGFTGTQMIGEAVNTPGASNEIITIVVPPFGMCGDPATRIHAVQGNGPASPLTGLVAIIEGVVVSNFQGTNQIGGYHVQEQDSEVDGDPLTSEGIYVFDNINTPAVGDVVRVEGIVTEFFGLTEINGLFGFETCSTGNPLPATTSLSLPVTTVTDFEAYEGMLVTFPQALVISEYFNFDRFNETVLTSERHLTPTAEFEPGAPAIQAAQDFLLDKITLDDGRGNQNPDPAIHPNGSPFDLDNLFRGGDTVANVTGVMDFSFGLYRIQPTQGADYTSVNPRTAEPDDVGGSLKVSSFNVLNYFTTIDTGAFICGPAGNQECRGADNANELERQRDKIIAAMEAIDADILGLIEIENHPGDVPTADLVSGLNDAMGAGTYDYIATGAIGTDAIRLAFIYKPASVTPVGPYAILDTSVDPRFLDDFNRPALAQTFQENSTGGVFTVAVNHLKSKGSDCNAIDDPDLGDGAGNCNLTRKAAAEALVDWLASDPTGSGDEDSIIIGDLNSYDKEDPIDVLVAGGYTDLVYQFLGEDAYSYVFDGQTGYLDHALANAGLLDKVTGVTIWHINADEADLIDYDTSFKGPNQDAIYDDDAYRSSDHDPVIVGIDPTRCNGLPATIIGTPDDDEITGTNGDDVIVALGGSDTINGGNGNDVICGDGGDDTLNGGNGIDLLFGSFRQRHPEWR
jgi:predicted extracellular nuclease